MGNLRVALCRVWYTQYQNELTANQGSFEASGIHKSCLYFDCINITFTIVDPPDNHAYFRSVHVGIEYLEMLYVESWFSIMSAVPTPEGSWFKCMFYMRRPIINV